MLIPLGFWAASAGGGAAGGAAFDLLETQVLASTSASVSFTSLSTYAADYQHLQIRMAANSSSIGGNYLMRFNADTGSNYAGHFLVGTGSSVLSGKTSNTTDLALGTIIGSQFGAAVCDILDPFVSTKNTTVRSLVGNTTQNRIDLMSGVYLQNTAISSINLRPDAGSWLTGSRFSLYGIRGG